MMHNVAAWVHLAILILGLITNYGVPFVKICEVNGGNACMACQV